MHLKTLTSLPVHTGISALWALVSQGNYCFLLFSLTDQCKDLQPADCPRWAERKYCTSENFIEWMKKTCAKSCGYCGTSTGNCHKSYIFSIYFTKLHLFALSLTPFFVMHLHSEQCCQSTGPQLNTMYKIKA